MSACRSTDSRAESRRAVKVSVRRLVSAQCSVAQLMVRNEIAYLSIVLPMGGNVGVGQAYNEWDVCLWLNQK